MKRTRSNLIDAFLFNVKKKYVTGTEGSSGPVILGKIAVALQEILDGADPDDALQIERKRGQSADPRNFTVASIIRAHRKEREKVAVAYMYANIWLEGNGHKTLSDKRLREIYKLHKAKLEQLESIALMIKKLSSCQTKRNSILEILSPEVDRQSSSGTYNR